VTRSRVYLQVERVDAATCSAAARSNVSDLHEALGRPRCHQQTMDPSMRPLIEGLRIAGPAVTASCPPGDNLMMHRALFLARAGDVLVVRAPESGAQWGDIAAYYAMKKGLAGIVVDGFIRDTDELRALRSPVWATKIGPSSPQKGGHGLVNAPVDCAGVRVEPGDLVVADGDGVIVVPRQDASAIVSRALARKEREGVERARIDDGAHPWHLHGAADNYENMDVEEIDAPWRP
jgi:4-hydroxy-4-methyl-2-oxoglutarate aldolase